MLSQLVLFLLIEIGCQLPQGQFGIKDLKISCQKVLANTTVMVMQLDLPIISNSTLVLSSYY